MRNSPETLTITTIGSEFCLPQPLVFRRNEQDETIFYTCEKIPGERFYLIGETGAQIQVVDELALLCSKFLVSEPATLGPGGLRLRESLAKVITPSSTWSHFENSNNKATQRSSDMQTVPVSVLKSLADELAGHQIYELRVSIPLATVLLLTPRMQQTYLASRLNAAGSADSIRMFINGTEYKAYICYEYDGHDGVAILWTVREGANEIEHFECLLDKESMTSEIQLKDWVRKIGAGPYVGIDWAKPGSESTTVTTKVTPAKPESESESSPGTKNDEPKFEATRDCYGLTIRFPDRGMFYGKDKFDSRTLLTGRTRLYHIPSGIEVVASDFETAWKQMAERLAEELRGI